MAWFKSTQISIQDGNDTVYPIQNPSLGSKMYSEADINNIALALDRNVRVHDMADIVRPLRGGLGATETVINTATYTSSNLEAD